MSLSGYSLNMSTLSPEERSALLDKIETYAFTGAHYNPFTCMCEFYLYSPKQLSLLKIPETCLLVQIG